MTDTRSVSSSVTVSASPQVAFTAFTEEMDLWWVRGPINFFDASRAVAVCYARPVTAARWLAEAFGLRTPRSLPGPEPGHDQDAERTWLEFRVGRCSVLLFKAGTSPGEPVPVTHVPWIYVDDLDAHVATATAAGAKIVEPVSQHGFRAYQAEDLEGHRWTFVQARPTMR